MNSTRSSILYRSDAGLWSSCSNPAVFPTRSVVICFRQTCLLRNLAPFLDGFFGQLKISKSHTEFHDSGRACNTGSQNQVEFRNESELYINDVARRRYYKLSPQCMTFRQTDRSDSPSSTTTVPGVHHSLVSDTRRDNAHSNLPTGLSSRVASVIQLHSLRCTST